MNELFIEIYSEEIPARMQAEAQKQAHDLFSKLLTAQGAMYQAVAAFVAPQRLVIRVDQLQPLTQSTAETRRGPRLGAPEAALAGFAQSTGKSQDQWYQRDGYWYVDTVQVGQEITHILPQLVTAFLDHFAWPKSMRWHNPETNTFTRPWIRPIRSVICVYNKKAVSFKIPGLNLTTGNKTVGHRFLSPQPIQVESFTDYVERLKNAFVILDPQERQKKIKHSLEEQAASLGLLVQDNQPLLDEVTGLVDYPFVHVGKIDPQFMDLPDPVLSTSMRVHQKYFSFLKGQKLAPYFGVVTNVNPVDNQEMMAGYERVLKARLSDAAFFYQTDCKTPLENLASKLDSITFHAKLGSLGQKIQRLQSLMTTEEGKRAAYLCKADLVTHMVGEFPELQGIMGQIYASLRDEPWAVTLALKEYYQPLGPDDSCPTEPLSVELALADKIDTLVGFLGVGIKPTGSKDPFGLRRAALGVIRLIDYTDHNFDLLPLLQSSIETYQEQGIVLLPDTKQEVIFFINDRLTVYLRGQNLDCVNAILVKAKKADTYIILDLKERCQALQEFLDTEDGKELKKAYRRASGILDKIQKHYDFSPELIKEDAEKNLYRYIQSQTDGWHSIKNKSYKQIMHGLAQLRPFIDAFFETVMVNVEDQQLRQNRYALLQLFVEAVNSIADFSQLQ